MKNKKIFLSLSIIVGVVALAYGGTRSFFSDSETSTGNTFTAGAIDLKIDNESYVTSTSTGQLALNPRTSWSLRDLTIEKFFDFTDVKPGDVGEDTISFHVDNNDSWLCAAVKLTSNDENSNLQPEIKDGDTTIGAGNGELANQINFIWWADDGDNVLETNELVLPGGPIGALNVGDEATVSLADAETNIWGDTGPLPGNSDRFIGKGWCFGALTETPVTQDEQGKTGSNGPLVRGTGFSCDGSQVNNTAQTDSLTADVTFSSIQSRNNLGYLCSPGTTEPTGTITIKKIIINDDGGTATSTDFSYFIDSTSVANHIPKNFAPGTYTVSELGVSGYEATFSGDCDATTVQITIANSENKICTITNDDISPVVNILKIVDVGNASPTSFTVRVDGTIVPTGGSKPVTANTNHSITEDAHGAYHFVGITGSGCPANLGDAFQLTPGQSITCSIHNAQN
ncbi:MAG: TasA family protein [Patescibacteria group bacterium]